MSKELLQALKDMGVTRKMWLLELEVTDVEPEQEEEVEYED